jgi:3-oxo-5alpha-steroid 4-dehydrogenase
VRRSGQRVEEVDVLVVGLGGAGACAVIEAVDNGASVLALDRVTGGGATSISGGIVHAGGGNSHQKAAGRNASGICSESYVSGLPIADCVYSGCRAGHSAATAS